MKFMIILIWKEINLVFGEAGIFYMVQTLPNIWVRVITNLNELTEHGTTLFIGKY